MPAVLARKAQICATIERTKIFEAMRSSLGQDKEKETAFMSQHSGLPALDTPSDGYDFSILEAAPRLARALTQTVVRQPTAMRSMHL